MTAGAETEDLPDQGVKFFNKLDSCNNLTAARVMGGCRNFQNGSW
jgi:hypothetical protein